LSTASQHRLDGSAADLRAWRNRCRARGVLPAMGLLRDPLFLLLMAAVAAIAFFVVGLAM
jgi:hypothetical protein